MVKWELKGNRVLLLDINFGLVADPKQPISMAVKAANNDAIIHAFPVAAFARDGAPVIEVTRLFTGDLQEFSARQRLEATPVARIFAPSDLDIDDLAEALRSLQGPTGPPQIGASSRSNPDLLSFPPITSPYRLRG